MSNPEFKGTRNLLLGVLTIWFLAVLLAGYIGVFDVGSPYSMRVPIPLGLGVALPLILFGIWFRISQRFRTYMLSINPVLLTAAHTWRVGGIVFLILYAQGVLPRSFAFPAGFGDMAIGITAPLIAWAVARKKISSGGFILWHLAGMADLVIAVVTGVLASPSRIGILAHGTTTRALGLLPLSLIPTFFVPLLFVLHWISIARARRTGVERGDSSVSSVSIQATA